jgi:hypothetical protein
MKAFINGTVITPGGMIENGVLITKGDKIIQVLDQGEGRAQIQRE